MGNACSKCQPRVIIGEDDIAVHCNFAWMPVEREPKYYNMTHTRRGIAIIFNHESFDNRSLTVREGTNVDVFNLKYTLKGLGFEVRVYKDLKYNELMKTAEEVANSDHSNCDCFILTILSHGYDEQLHAKDHSYNFGSLYAMFAADKCPTLAGKPKLFFLQACQGYQQDKGVELLQRNECDGGCIMGYKIPKHADILIIHATLPGFVAYRNTVSGSFFVRALCYELKTNGTSSEISDIVTSVNYHVAVNYQTEDKMKQMTSGFTTLLRRLIFTRKEANKTEVSNA
jgi:caspase-like apoptosis-related cysteine protease